MPVDEVLAAAKMISGLDPKPGSLYGQDEVHYIIPDIFVYKVGDEYVVVLNDEGLPNLRISSFYRSALSGAVSIDAKADEYIQEKMRRRAVADQEHPPAPAHHLQGHQEHRQIPA